MSHLHLHALTWYLQAVKKQRSQPRWRTGGCMCSRWTSRCCMCGIWEASAEVCWCRQNFGHCWTPSRREAIGMLLGCHSGTLSFNILWYRAVCGDIGVCCAIGVCQFLVVLCCALLIPMASRMSVARNIHMLLCRWPAAVLLSCY